MKAEKAQILIEESPVIGPIKESLGAGGTGEAESHRARHQWQVPHSEYVPAPYY